MGKMKWAVVRCMDGRINTDLNAFLKENRIPENHDLISLPGGCQDLTDPKSVPSLALKNVSVEGHAIEHILLVQHTDCAAYGGRAKCGGNEARDLVFQRQELRVAMRTIRARHPELQIRALLIHLKDDESVELFELTFEADAS
jgi:hypothetical protein